jgi:hypothetical protein
MDSNPQICSSQDYSQPVCTPNNKTIWYSNTYNLATWEVSNTLYFYYDKLNIYFYYRKNYQFFKTVNFTNIGINQGYYSLYVNNDFFPSNCTQNVEIFNYTMLLLGNGTNPDDVIDDPLSKWERIDFNIIQNITCVSNNNTSNETNIQYENSKSDNSLKLEVWKIIIIVICCLLFIIISIILIKIKFFKNKKTFIKNNDLIYQKPNEIEIYQKINSK